MPSSAGIQELLAATTRELAPLALAWHLALAAIAVAYLRGWRPAPHRCAPLLAVPVLSVSIVAFAFGNMLDGASFAALAIILVVTGLRAPGVHLERGPAWSRWLGCALILFGMWYPHLVEGAWYRVLAVAPLGVVPCPTLALVAGVTLVADGFGSRAIPAVIALWAGFYARLGIFNQGALVDIGLLVAMLGLIAMLVHNEARSGRTRRSRMPAAAPANHAMGPS